jgi:1-acyl-sn-glycerol-3-phosphate acyltransferase
MAVKPLFIKLAWGIRLIFGIVLVIYPIFICLGVLSIASIISNGDGRLVRRGIRKALQIHARIVGIDYNSAIHPLIDPSREYLLLADFRSIIDITAIVVTAPKEDTVTVIRKHNFYVPILGWCLKAAQYVPFQRRKPQLMFRNLVKVMKKNEMSFIFFPRGHTDQIRNQKDLPKSYLKLIHLLKLDVIPVSFNDEEIYKSDVIPQFKTTVNYGKPISYLALSKMNNDEIHQLIFNEIYTDRLA